MSAENEKRETDKSERSPWIQRAGPTPGGGPSPWAPPGRPGSGRTDATPVTESRLERIQKLGEGGYGEVWLVKYLGALEAHKHLNKRAGAQKNAFREAVNTRAVNHPNVVKVVDVFEDADGPVLRMEYVDGTDLGHQVMEDGIFPVERVLPIGIQIADALQATHERGIVHLDLKPSNVILRKDGQSVVVTDFGISGALRVSEGKQAVGKGGTPYFMAPELHQANGTGTPSSDIWSLGVTLYWLLSGSFPFAFDTKDPGEAVLEPPRDLTQSHRYVSAEFWALLRRMLSRDVERRPGSMADVRRGFEACAYELTCPACTRSFRVETISGVCPESRCQDPRVVTLKAALLARRGAETALAECRFSEAGRGFEKAGSEFRSLEGFEESVTWTESLVRAIPGLAKDHDDLIASAETLLENERYLDCVAKMHEARYRYSRSPALMKLRAALRARLAELHKATPELVKELTRRREFDEAREQLTRIDHILANERARAELEFGLAAAGEEVKEFRWLYQEVDRQQDAFKNWTQAGKDALADFAFKKAFDAYSSLERDFSAEEYERLLAALATAETKYDKATMFDDEFLRALVHDPTVGDRVERLHLDEARQACASLIEDFPVEEHPCFQPIAERRKAYEQAANAVRRHVEENLEKCAGARKKRKVFEELERLDKFKDLVLRSDLFDAKVRESVTDRHRACSQAVEEIRTHYREGKQAFERREFAPAQHALRLVEAMAPGGYEDVPEMLQEIDERIHEIQALKAQVAEHFGHIERGYYDLSTAIEALSKASELYQLSAQKERELRAKSDARILQILIDSQRQHLGGVIAESPDSTHAVVSFVGEYTLPLLDALRWDQWKELLATTPELRRAICGLFQTAEPAARSDLQSMLGGIGALLPLLETSPLLAILRNCPPPPGSFHPSTRLAGLLVGAVRRAGWEQRQKLAEGALGLLARLAELCPAELTDHGDLGQGDIRRILIQTRAHAFGTRLVAFGRRVGPWAAAVLAAMLFGWFAQDVFASKSLFRDAKARLDLETANAAGTIDAWLGASSGETQRQDRLSALRDWEGLLNPGTRPSVSVAAGARALDTLAAEPALDQELREELEDDLLSRTTSLVAKLCQDAEAELEPLAALGHVRLRLAELAGLVRTLAPLATSTEQFFVQLETLSRSFDSSRSANRNRELLQKLARLLEQSPEQHRKFLSRILRGVLVDGLVRSSRRAVLGDVAGFGKTAQELLQALERLPGLPKAPEPGNDLRSRIHEIVGGLQEGSTR